MLHTNITNYRFISFNTVLANWIKRFAKYYMESRTSSYAYVLHDVHVKITCTGNVVNYIKII
jgi:hypothetical protein